MGMLSHAKVFFHWLVDSEIVLQSRMEAGLLPDETPLWPLINSVAPGKHCELHEVARPIIQMYSFCNFGPSRTPSEWNVFLALVEALLALNLLYGRFLSRFVAFLQV